MADKRIDYETAKKKERKFVRPSEGAAKYSMGITKFTQLAAFCAAERTPVRLLADTRRRQRTAL